jgi:hypothetical protein
MNNESLKYKKDINECFYRNIFNVTYLFVTRNGQNYLLYKKNKKKYLLFNIHLFSFDLNKQKKQWNIITIKP